MGLRIVAKAERKGIYEDCETISDFQYKLAEKLGALEYLDTVCYDYARASFVPQEEDILYIHTQRLFFENPELVLDASKGGPSKFLVPRASAPVAHNGGVPGTLFTEDSSQDSYEGVALDKIFEEYMVLTGGMPEPGGRNSRFYAAARNLRYICDFNPKVIAAHLPQCGLPDAEVYQLCASACMSARGFNIPENVVRAISYAKQMLVDAEEPIEADVEVDNFEAPILIREFTSRCPEDFRDATLLALLPILGTLATALRARYIDDEVHSPTFYTVVMSEQASGKSFARRLVAELMQSVVAEDATARAVEKEYQAQVKMTKNKDLLPPAPQVKVRIVPPATSLAKLIMRLDQAREEHLFTYCEEMDTLTKSERAGAWSQKSDLYRDGFDNQYYGQDYMSEQSYSAMVRVFYNLLILGTPRQVFRFFSDIENGLVSRVCVATYSDQFVKPMPMFKKIDDETHLRIQQMVKKLRSAKGMVDLDFLFSALTAWLEKQRIEAILTNDRARDTFRKRSSVMGFRAVLAISPFYDLTDVDVQQKLTDFAIYIADKVLSSQLIFVGDKLNKLADSADTPRQQSRLFDLLPDEFTTEQISLLLMQERIKTPARQILYRCRTNAFVEEVHKGQYKKIKCQNKLREQLYEKED